MMVAVPWLTLRVRPMDTGIPLLPQGVSLTYALFVEAAGHELLALNLFHRCLFWFMDEAQFLSDGRPVCQHRWHGQHSDRIFQLIVLNK